MKARVTVDLIHIAPRIERLFDVMREDYRKWQRDPESEIGRQMIDEYCNGLTYEVGGKFIKLITGRESGYQSVVGFIVIADGGKWKSGDLLKAASWKAPAQNFKRGNIFEPASYANVRWTGIS